MTTPRVVRLPSGDAARCFSVSIRPFGVSLLPTVVHFSISDQISGIMQKPTSITIGKKTILVRNIGFEGYSQEPIKKISDTIKESAYRMRETVTFIVAAKQADFVSTVELLVNVEEAQSRGAYQGRLLGMKHIPNTDDEITIEAVRIYDGVFPRGLWG